MGNFVIFCCGSFIKSAVLLFTIIFVYPATELKAQLPPWEDPGLQSESSSSIHHASLYAVKGNVESIREVAYGAVDRSGKIEMGEALMERMLKYDGLGNLTEAVVVLYRDKKEYLEKLVYNAAGQCVEKSEYKKNGSLSSKRMYKYNADNNIEEVSYYESGKLQQKTTYKNNDYGQSTESKTYDSRGKLTATRTYKYNSAGNLREVVKIYADEPDDKGIISLEYDGRGKIESIKLGGSYKLGGGYSIYYDRNGNIVKNQHLPSGGGEYYEYKYDDNGNWTEKRERSYHGSSSSPINSYITVREITYR